MKKDYQLSVVIPAFQAEQTIELLMTRLSATLKNLGLYYEIIIVEDGSTDETWNIIQEFAFKEDGITGVKFSRNFGQHNAISAGLAIAKGDWVVVMDCDLQDQPEEIPKLFAKAQEGFDIVVGQKIVRRDNNFKVKTSKMFYKVFWALTGLSFEKGTGNFGIYRKKVIEAVLLFKENFRPFPIVVKVVGFRRTAIEIEHAQRHTGRSTYNNFSLLKGAVDTIIYYSHRPIWLFLIVGLGIVAFLFFLITAILFLTLKITILDLIILLIVLMSFVSINIAMIGVYVSRLFIELKKRPSYIIEKTA